MARFRKIDPRIWNDQKFMDLSDQGKLCFFFLLTHPHMTALGAMRGTIPGLAEELGWSPEAFREAFEEAFSKGMVEHDSEAKIVALPNFLRYNSPESPNVVKAWFSAVDLIPEGSLKTRVIARAKTYAEALSKAYAEAFREAFVKAMPNQEQEQEQDKYNVPSGVFDLFWKSWPSNSRKGGKSKCMEVWRRHKFDSCAAQIMAHLDAMKKSPDWRKDDGRFVPAPLTYLNQRRWDGAGLSAASAEPSAQFRQRAGQWERYDESAGWFVVPASEVPDSVRSAA